MSSPVGSEPITFPAIPGYELLELLGQGGMGTVYLARQPVLNRQVCVKVLSDLEDEGPDVGRARFRREAELLASVAHPHILSIFDFGVTPDSDRPYLVTEYIEGGDLRRRLADARPLPIREARRLLGQAGEALQYLHARGILHRDLKPENVYLLTEHLCKIGDFGLAVRREAAGELTGSRRGLGTAGYVAPEQQYGLTVTERSDQFSLAALAYELLTGKRPLGRFTPPSRLNRALPHDVDRVILRGLADEPADRYPSIRAFLDELGRSLDRPRRLSARRLALVAGLALLLMVVGSAATARLRLPGDPPKPAVAQARKVKRAPAPAPAVVKPTQPPKPAPPPPPRSPEFLALVKHRSYRLWVEEGRPEGAVVREANWREAERLIEAEVDLRAYRYWQAQGSPEGARGEAVREQNRRRAEAELLKETEAALRPAPGRANGAP